MTPSPSPNPVTAISGSWWTSDGAATILAAVIAALVVVVGYFIQQNFIRRERRARAYSEAVRAVEDYMEAPFLILRRDGTVGTQRHITDHISDIQSRIAYHQAELSIYASSDIAAAYSDVVRAARSEAGTAMTDAWNARPTKQGRAVPLGSRFSREQSDAALNKLVALMRRDTYRGL
jgi:hypothetical protein